MQLHTLIEKEQDGYSALCLELDVASQGDSVEEARENLQEAVALYLEAVCEDDDEKDFVPRPAPREEWVKYFEVHARKLGKLIGSDKSALTYEEVVYAKA